MVGGVDGVEVGAGRSLADVRGERTPRLVRKDILVRERKREVIVALGIRREHRVIEQGRKVDGCALMRDEFVCSVDKRLSDVRSSTFQPCVLRGERSLVRG